MQKMINAPQAVVDEMVEGYLKAHPDLVAGTIGRLLTCGSEASWRS